MPILLPIGSNLFMTTARYGCLKFTDRPPWLVTMIGRGIACFDYPLAVPAAQLTAIQERDSGTRSRKSSR